MTTAFALPRYQRVLIATLIALGFPIFALAEQARFSGQKPWPLHSYWVMRQIARW